MSPNSFLEENYVNSKNDFRDFEYKGWESVAHKYGYAWSSLTKKFIPSLLDSVNIKPGIKLLDLACGPGYVSEAAITLGALPVGIDFSKKMIKLAKERNPSIEFFEGDAEDLNFEPGSFDAVTMNFGMLHMSDPEKVFSEAARVLKKRGRFAFTIWAKPEINPGSKVMDDAINKYADLNLAIPKGPSTLNYCDPAECFKSFKFAGFNTDSMRFITVDVVWEVPTSSFFFEAELNAGVRTSAVLKIQSEKALEQIRSCVEKEIEKLKNKDGYFIPMAAHIVSAARNN